MSKLAGYHLPSVAEPEGEAYMGAIQVLLPYLLSHRSRLAAASLAEEGSLGGTEGSGGAAAGDAAAGGSGVGPSDDEDTPRELANLTREQRSCLTMLVDTAIMKVGGRQKTRTYDKYSRINFPSHKQIGPKQFGLSSVRAACAMVSRH